MAGTTTSWLKSEITRAGGITACARQLGVSTTAVEHWYTGRNHPSDRHAGELAGWLGIPEPVLRQRLGMPLYNDDVVTAWENGLQTGLDMVLVAVAKAADLVDDARQVRKSS